MVIGDSSTSTIAGCQTVAGTGALRSRAVRAIQIVDLSGPESALKLVELPEPEASHMTTPGAGVLVDVHAAGVSFPELLQTRGEYQFKPPLPFVPGSEAGGVVREVSGDAAVKPGDRVAAFCMLGAWAEVAVAPVHTCFPLPDELDFAQGASLVLNYHTAYFALKLRGRLKHEGETVLVHGAGGRGGHGGAPGCEGAARAYDRDRLHRGEGADSAQAGADHVLMADEPWKDQAKELSGGGVDIVLDPVGGDRFTDSVRSLGEGGRVVVVGFTGGSIPEVRVNRLLLSNTEIIGAGWGAYVMSKPHVTREIGEALAGLMAAGAVRPIVGARFPLTQAADALELLDSRGATGKVVLEVR